MQETEFEIDRNAVRNYFVAVWVLLCFCMPAFFFSPIGCFSLLEGQQSGFVTFVVVLSVLALFLIIPSVFCLWLCPQQANNLRYRLEGSTVWVDGGVFFLFRKSIPLERITGVALVQGPLLRYFGIWAMRIQTAGSAQCEVTLYGVRNPEEVRELILSQRQRIDGEKAADA